MENKKLEKFYKAWYFISQHPRFMDDGNETFPYGLEIMPVKVDPKTKSIGGSDEENTLIQIWLEHGPYEYVKSMLQNVPTHDIDLDCGGNTFEDAIIKLAQLIKKKYGDYEPQEEDA